MGFIAALLLMTMTEEDTFWMLVTMLYDSDKEINSHETGIDALKESLEKTNNNNEEIDSNAEEENKHEQRMLVRKTTVDEYFESLVKNNSHFKGYQLRGLYLDGLPLLHLRYFQLKELLKQFFPRISQHLVTFAFCIRYFMLDFVLYI